MADLLLTAIEASTTDIFITDGPAKTAIMNEFAFNAHAQFAIYTAANKEYVIATAKNSDGSFKVVRGQAGTSARAWPACSGIAEVTKIAAGANASSDAASNARCCCSFSVVAGKGLKVVQDGTKFTISLMPSGVEPGDYGGLHIDECGRVTRIHQNFPKNNLVTWVCHPKEG